MPYETIHLKAPDLTAMLETDLPLLVRRARQVKYLKLALSLTGVRRPKLVELVPPNKLTFDRRSHEGVVRSFLTGNGFLTTGEVDAAQRVLL